MASPIHRCARGGNRYGETFPMLFSDEFRYIQSYAKDEICLVFETLKFAGGRHFNRRGGKQREGFGIWGKYCIAIIFAAEKMAFIDT